MTGSFVNLANQSFAYLTGGPNRFGGRISNRIGQSRQLHVRDLGLSFVFSPATVARHKDQERFRLTDRRPEKMGRCDHLSENCRRPHIQIQVFLEEVQGGS